MREPTSAIRREPRARPPLRGTAALLALATLAGTTAVAAPWPGPPQRFLDQAQSAATREGGTCAARAPALDAQGVVTGSPLLAQIEGAAAGTTGGLGKRLLTVTRLDDVKSSHTHPSPEGTLRWAVDTARGAGGAWITFASGLEGTIHLAAGLKLPSNVTLDGGCGGITLTGSPRITQLGVTDAENIVISGLAFTKDAYDDKLDKTGDAIGLTDQFDRVAILHNAFDRCGDGCVDIVRKERFATTSRATVAFNHFAHHNKVMLIGTLTCYKDKGAEGCADPIGTITGVLEPRVFVSIVANVFAGTSQRHPKVVSNAAVQFANNLVTLAPTPYSNGVDSAVYGAATGTGGVLVAQGNVLVNPDRTARVGVGTISVVRASNGGGDEADGVVAAERNVTVGNVRVVEHQPEIARAVRMSAAPVVSVTPDTAEALAACLLRVSGPRGAALAWPDACRMP